MFSKLVRLGKDAELATTPSGKQVMKIAAAYDVGWGDNKKTVWVNGSMWGDRGAKVAQYLTKGVQVVLHADDVEPQSYTDKNGSVKCTLAINIVNVELIARSQQQSQGDHPARPAPAVQQSYMAPAQEPDFDDDIPF